MYEKDPAARHTREPNIQVTADTKNRSTGSSTGRFTNFVNRKTARRTLPAENRLTEIYLSLQQPVLNHKELLVQSVPDFCTPLIKRQR